MTDSDKEGLAGLPESIEVDHADIEKIAGIPLRAQQIGALMACGFAPTDIDAAFNLSEGTASVYKHKYFTDKSLSISPKTRDSILAAYLRSKAIGLVAGITPSKVKNAGVGELSKSASMLFARVSELEGSNTVQDIGAKVSAALSKLAQVSNSKQLVSVNGGEGDDGK
jgi:hypothetical protein